MDVLITNPTFQHLLNQVPVGILILDNEFHVRFWNSVLAVWTGIHTEEVIGKNILLLYPHLQQVKFLSRIESVLNDGPPVVCSAQLHGYFIPCYTNKGKERIQHTTLASMFSEDRKTVYALITIQDVTDLNEKIDRLREMKDHAEMEKNTAQLYMDIAGVIILELSRDHRIVVLNKKGCDTLGVLEKDVIGTDWIENFVPKKDHAKTIEALGRLLQGRLEEDEFVENDIVTRDGIIRTIAWHNTIIRDAEGRIEGVLSSGEDVTEKKRFLDILFQKSVTDPLTKVYNRGYFFEVVENEIRYAKRHHQDFSLAILDIDHFKNINDRFGHQAGDEALRQLTTVLRKNLREYDMIARYGGEEFILYFKNTKNGTAFSILERVREYMQTLSIEYENYCFQITFSAGLVSYHEFETPRPASIDDIVRVADKRLYASKEAGRNRITGV